MAAVLRNLGRGLLCCHNVARFSCPAASTCVHKCKLLVVGGGAGGCNIAWRFSKKLKSKEIIILEPKENHYYQPLFTLVAAGIKNLKQARRPFISVMPHGVCWMRASAAQFEPAQCLVHTDCGDHIQYEYMVVALGLNNDFDKIPGLAECLENPRSGVSTIYSSQYCTKTWTDVRNLCGGHALFTFPTQAGKCGGAALKIMFLADDYWRKKKRRNCISITYNTAGEALFGVPKYATALAKIAADRATAVNYRSELVEVHPNRALFQHGEEQVSVPFTFLHVTPPMATPTCLRCSELANEQGYLQVDRHTLQHVNFSNVYGLGDCTDTPNSKTAAAIGPQSYVVEQNLLATMQNRSPPASYDGYSACPVLTSYKRGILAEFSYDKTVRQTFPFDQSKERRLFYYLNSYFSHLYWNKLIKGKYNGPQKLRKIINPLGRS